MAVGCIKIECDMSMMTTLCHHLSIMNSMTMINRLAAA